MDFFMDFSATGGTAGVAGWGGGLIVLVVQAVNTQSKMSAINVGWFFIEYWLK